jgi:carboxymethylenebutenolidase
MTDIHQEKIRLKLSDHTEMQCFTASPREVKPTAGIIVFQEAFGVNNHIRKVALRFAQEGYRTIAPELFHRTAPEGFEAGYGDFAALGPHFGGISPQGLTADAQGCFNWLTSQGVQKIGCVGYCLGGRASFVANASLPLAAAVSYYGGGIAQSHLDLAKDQKSPILLFWGGLDKHILPEHTQSVAKALREANKSFVNVEFSQADHGFHCDERPSFNSEASQEAWALTKSFFKNHLA